MLKSTVCAFIFVAIVLLYSCTVPITEDQLFYGYSTKVPENLKMEDIYFPFNDSLRLNGWFLKHSDTSITLLSFGGNGFQLVGSYDLIRELSKLNMNIFLIDYPGYGKSDGKASAEAVYQSALAAYRYLCARSDVDSNKIFVHGHSLGSFAAMKVATTYNIAGVILESPVTNTNDAMKNAIPWYIKLFISIKIPERLLEYDNAKEATKLTSPLLILVGEDDDMTPPSMAETILKASTSKSKRMCVIPDGDHNNLSAKKEFYPTIVEFVDKTLSLDPNRKDRAILFYDLGLGYVREKKYTKGKEAFLKTLQMDSTILVVYYQLGKITAETGEDLEKGLQYYQKYLNVEPKRNEPPRSATHWRMGMIYEKMGKKEEAKSEYRKTLELDPQFKQAKESLEKLED